MHPGIKSLIGPSASDKELATTQSRPAESKRSANANQRLFDKIVFPIFCGTIILGMLYVAFFIAQPEGNRKNAMRQAEHEAIINGQQVLAEMSVELRKLRVAVEQLSSS